MADYVSIFPSPFFEVGLELSASGTIYSQYFLMKSEHRPNQQEKREKGENTEFKKKMEEVMVMSQKRLTGMPQALLSTPTSRSLSQ